MDAHKDARTQAELAAWALLVELCEDDCVVFETTADMRAAVLKVEKQLKRLHGVEQIAVELANRTFVLCGAATP